MDAAQDFLGNVAILSEDLDYESWFNTFWAPFAGNVDISKDDNGNALLRPSGMPIEILDRFIELTAKSEKPAQVTKSRIMGDGLLKLK